MDPNEHMLQQMKAAMKPGRIVLLLAVVALGFALGFSLKRNSGNLDVPAPAGYAAASGGNDPLAPLEARTRASPDDASAWAALGSGHFDAGEYDNAVQSFARAASLSPQTAMFHSSLGEARVMASRRDPLPEAARRDFERALAIDPEDPRARYFMAVARDLSGDHQGAIDDWLALLADTPVGAPWEADLRRTIEQVAKINGISLADRLARVVQPQGRMPVAARGISGPSAEDLRNAAAIPPAQQREMAQGMVARLEARLRASPTNPDGWIMLIRSHMALGQPDQAARALKDAVAANPASAAMLRDQAALLGAR